MRISGRKRPQLEALEARRRRVADRPTLASQPGSESLLDPRLVPTGRRFLSVALLEYGSQCGWEEAARLLALRRMPQGAFVGWVNRAIREGVAEELRAELDALFRRLVEQAPPVNYHARRQAFGDFTVLDEVTWRAALDGARLRDGNARRYSAAAWLWCQLTGGYLPEAPALWTAPKRGREIYGRFAAHELPRLHPALVEHGGDLLVWAGLSGPVEHCWATP